MSSIRCVTFVTVFLAVVVAHASIGRAFDSDDFDRPNLDPARWTLVDPLADGWVTMQGAGSGDAQLELSVPEGPSHDPSNTNRSLRVMQPIADADFVLEARFESDPSARFQIQGFIVEADATNWLRFDTFHDGSGQRIYSAETVGGSTSTEINSSIAAGAARHMRITRTGDVWTFEYSPDGISYTVAGSYTRAFSVSTAGVFVANHASSGDSPAYTAVVDWVEIASAPIVDEDGSVEPDVLPPLIQRIQTQASPAQLEISWYTDEPSMGTVDWGTSTLYELGSVSDGGGLYFHSLPITGLVPGNTYHYRIRSSDGLAQESSSGDIQILFDPVGPDIEIFYGDAQPFGAVGQPQPWVNILGNVSDPDGVSALEYSLNAGAPISLTIGPDGRRLAEPGDFNVDLNVGTLLSGTNTLDITATDGVGNDSTEPLTFEYTPGTLWPFPVFIDWTTLVFDDEIQDVAQVVDGRWTLDAGNVRTLDPGYDRLIAIGDRTWTDYEFTVPIIRHDSPGGFGVGVLLRWDGHTDSPVVCVQPKCGYLPLGAILWSRSAEIEIFGNDTTIYDSQPRTLTQGVTYWYKGRVESLPTGSVYSLKVWEDGQPEPGTWDIVGQGLPGDPQQGSLLLISHLADVSFGNVSVTQLAPPQNFPPEANDDAAFVQPGASVDIDVLANDIDVDGTLDPASVVVQSLPSNGTATPNLGTGRILYVHDGSSTLSDSFTYTVDDAQGATSNIATVDVVVTPTPPAPIKSDDFNRSALDADLWALETPTGDGVVAQVGAGSGDAYLSFSLDAGTTHDAWGAGGVNESIRVMQDAPDVDFELEIKWNSEPTGGTNDQGILIEQGPNDWLRFDVFHTGTELKLFVGKTIGGTNASLLSKSIAPGSALYLRVERIGDRFTTYTSGDGVSWVLQHSFDQTLVVSRVGVYAANPVEGLAFVSQVDYFQNTAAPIAIEDANRIDVEIFGMGTVSLDPDLSDYGFGTEVVLSPVPSPGWTFVGWSGDLMGLDDPALLTVTQAMRVTALFAVKAPSLSPLPLAGLTALLALLGFSGLQRMRTASSRANTSSA